MRRCSADRDADPGSDGDQHAGTADGDSDADTARAHRDAGGLPERDARVVSDANFHEDAQADEDAEGLGVGHLQVGFDRPALGANRPAT